MEGDNGENQGGNIASPVQDPLEIAEILENVLSRLDCQEMKNARSVSKFWRDTAIPPWRKNTAVFNVDTITMGAIKLSLDVNSNSEDKLHMFLEKPFKQYKLHSDEGFHEFPPTLPAPENSLFFWDHCGPIMTYLDIANVSFFKANLEFEGLKWILSNCPNLEVLKFSPFQRLTDRVRMLRLNLNRTNDWEGAEAAAAKETVVAEKLKSLSISPGAVGREYDRTEAQLFWANALLARRFFNLMPNLKELEAYTGGSAIPAGLRRLTLGLVPLEKLFLRCSLQFPRNAFGYLDVQLWLLQYFRELGTSQKLKGLGYNCFVGSLCSYPSRLKNVLKAIRSRIEEFKLEVEIQAQVADLGEEIRSFDLFSYNFTKLSRLTLHFQYLSVEESRIRCGPGPELMRHFAFDFSVFRGTPNLEYFCFKNRPINHVPWLTRTLTAADLEGNGGILSWRLNNDGSEYRDLEEAANNIEVDDGDDVVFAPEEGEIVLKKMKEFHFEGCFSIEALQVLGRMMPNLKVLETILDNETFPAAFQVWGGNGRTLKKVKLLLLHEPQDWTGLISGMKKEFPEIKIVEAVGEENW